MYSAINLKCSVCGRVWDENMQMPAKITDMCQRLKTLKCECGADSRLVQLAKRDGADG